MKMEMKHYTSIEQSKKLLELGLSPESADMYYNFDIDFKTGETYFPADGSSIMVRTRHSLNPLNLELAIPCWSVGALIELMPESIDNDDYWLIIEKNLYEAPSRRIEYSFGYEHYNNLNDRYSRIVGSSTQIEAAYEMVVWLLENDYIQKGE